MYTMNVLAISGALLSAVAAVPMNKRDIVWVTETNVVMETVQATKTVWVQPGEEPTVSAAAYPSHYGHGHGHHSKPHLTSTIMSTATVQPIPSSPSPVESSSTPEAPSSTYVPPPPPSSSATSSSTSSSVYVPPPTTSSTYVAPPTTTSSTYVAPTTAAEPIPSTSTSAAAAPSSTYSGGSGSGESFTGQATYYTPGLGSCGTTASEADAVVAISYVNMDNGANSNSNPNCGKMINISYQGKTATAKVVDTCPGCAAGGIDLSPTVFQELAPLAEGRLFDVEWSYAS